MNRKRQSLNGWFDGFCPSNGIAENLERAANNKLVEFNNTREDLESLKNGKLQQDWENEQKQVKLLEAKVLTLQKQLKQEKAISKALGLGAWCNGAVARRKRAEITLNTIIANTNKIKGEIETLKKQQTEGLNEARKTHAQRQKEIADLSAEINRVKKKIQDYKTQRDNLKKEAVAKELQQKENELKNEKNKLSKTRLARTVKENGFFLLGVGAVLGVVVYMGKSKKKKNKK